MKMKLEIFIFFIRLLSSFGVNAQVRNSSTTDSQFTQTIDGDDGSSIFDENFGNSDNSNLVSGNSDKKEITFGTPGPDNSDLISGIPELSSQYPAKTFCDICQCINETATLLFVDCNYAGHPVGLDTIPPWPAKLEDIYNYTIVIDASYNEIQQVKSFPDIPVINLDLSNNDIRKIDTDAFVGISKYIEHLDLSGNKLDAESMSIESFRGSLETNGYFHFNVIQLSFAKNRLHTLAPDLFDHMVYLTTLDLSNNPLAPLTQDFQDAISSIASLQSLTLRNIGLDYLPSGFLSTLTDLTYLDLSSNLFTQIDPELKNLPGLESLNLDANLLQVIDETSFKGLNNLKNVSISECTRLQFVDQFSFQHQNNLQFLRIRKNPLFTWISPDAWPTQPNVSTNLIELDLSWNSLTYLPSTLLYSLDDWKQIQMINIQGNPWMCDCHNEWLIYDLVPMIHQTNPSMTQEILCGGPKETSLIKEEIIVVQQLTNHTQLQCTHDQFSFYNKDFIFHDEVLHNPRPRKQILPLALTIICVTAVMGIAAMVGYLYMEKKKRVRRTTRDNPTPRVAYIPANLARVRGYHRQHNEPTEHLATSFTDNPVENQNSIIRSQEKNRNSNVENVDDQMHGITNTNFNANS